MINEAELYKKALMAVSTALAVIAAKISNIPTDGKGQVMNALSLAVSFFYAHLWQITSISLFVGGILIAISFGNKSLESKGIEVVRFTTITMLLVITVPWMLEQIGLL